MRKCPMCYSEDIVSEKRINGNSECQSCGFKASTAQFDFEIRKDTDAEIMWQSTEKTPDGNPFMTVKKARNYYYYAERGGQDSIFFILYDANIDKYALINESKPPLDERFGKEMNKTTAFGGSIDCDKTSREICQMEVREEAGYDVPATRIYSFGETMVSTQMSQIAYGFLVDVTDITKTNIAEYEESSNNESVIWMTYDDVLENSDWKSIFIVAKSLNVVSAMK